MQVAPAVENLSDTLKALNLTQDEYQRIVQHLGREPNFNELAMFSVLWSEHCCYKNSRHLLRKLPSDKKVHVGVIDVRMLEIEHPEQVAERVRKVLQHIEPERVTLTTDCGLKQLPRVVAIQKLRALAEGAAIVRRELR